MKGPRKLKKPGKAKAQTSKTKNDHLGRINPKKEPLTVEKYRELSGLQLTDEEAEQAVDSINKLARVLYQFAKSNPLENKSGISSNNKQDTT